MPPLCNPMRDPLFWPLLDHRLTTVSPRPFWNWFGILILQLKNEFRILILQEQEYWSSKLKMSLGYWSLAFFFAILPRAPFFQQAGREGSDQKNFCRWCQILSRTIWVDYVTLLFTHNLRIFTNFPSKTWPLWPDTLYKVSIWRYQMIPTFYGLHFLFSMTPLNSQQGLAKPPPENKWAFRITLHWCSKSGYHWRRLKQ